MPIFAFAFGSFGDFVTTLQLINSMRKALCDSTGSNAEYQQLIVELDEFVRALKSLKSIPIPLNLVPQSVLNLRQDAIQSSNQLILFIHKKINGYQRSLQTGGSGNRWQDSWMKVWWGLFKMSELVDIRSRVRDQVGKLNLLLAILTNTGLEKQRKMLENVERTVNDLPEVIRNERHVVVNEVRVTLHDLLRNMNNQPYELGYTWECDSRPVVLLDALGQEIKLPFQLCETYDAFTELLKVHFKDCTGSNYVLCGQFALTLTLTSSRTVHSRKLRVQNWGKCVGPGSTITMQIIIVHNEMLSDESFQTSASICPNCGHDNKGRRRDHGGFTCFFHIAFTVKFGLLRRESRE
ncbi:hypothetical protein GYMLUDRAFT_55620 [Collybiopsis luxurians FD-317 M1]|nr:hypothetical protein GYMLUDRAFT_55620 [Collybiopsis luxurians FD-317 M1]